jgi:DNA-binding beta-propeller fold protein YncE
MYIVGVGTGTTGKVNDYSLSTPWDTSTASFVQFLSITSQDSNATGVFFKPDGTKMYLIGTSSDRVHEYNLSTAWDISTATVSQNFSVGAQDTTPQGLSFKDDGTKMYIIGAQGDDVNEYNLSTAWDISTASYSQNFSVNAQEAAPFDLFFKFDGTKMYIIGTLGDEVNEYDLSTAWDISTASFVQNFRVADQGEGAPHGLSFKDDGTKMFIVGTGKDTVFTYSLGVQE